MQVRVYAINAKTCNATVNLLHCCLLSTALLCFDNHCYYYCYYCKQQYFFINSLFAVGTVFGMIGVTMHLRSEYNLFADPVAPLLFLIMFLSCDMLQRLLRRLADIQVGTAIY
jgi:hypothetical protein